MNQETDWCLFQHRTTGVVVKRRPYVSESDVYYEYRLIGLVYADSTKNIWSHFIGPEYGALLFACAEELA